MNQRKLSLDQLLPSHVDSFFECQEKNTSDPSTRAQYKESLINYLKWLHQRRLILFDPQTRLIVYQKTVPLLAARFLQTLIPRFKPATIKACRSILRGFHHWLDEHDIEIEQLDRNLLVDWLNYLKNRWLKPASRELHIVYVRLYFRWLYEQGIIQHFPDDLIKKFDFPNIPQYLPRPLPLLADRDLQIRLAQSDSLYQLGLLLMRRTGLRISELQSLELDCLRTDPKGNNFLKVSLGKLDNERLVPMDDNTVELLKKLQDKGKNNKTWLLESPTGHKTRYATYVEIMHKVCNGLKIDGRMTTHRLRHSYATSLLGGGMSIASIMKLLGHKTYHMTLRYTAITPETIGKEYQKALNQIEKKYAAIDHPSIDSIQWKTTPANPLKMLDDTIRWIQKHNHQNTKTSANAIIKRINRLQIALKKLFPTLTTRF
jgi:site-specific recombinase XerD